MRRLPAGTQAVLVLLLSAASCACTVSGGEAPSLRPLDVSQFIVPAETRISLQLSMDAGTCTANMAFIVKDYSGIEESRGTVHCKADDTMVELPISVRRGYHEVFFPEFKATFGVIALDRLGDAMPDFFGVDTAFSYLERSPASREQFIGQLSRLGIASVRDRITWSELHPEIGEWSGNGPHQFDALRQLYARAGIKVTDVLQGLPENPPSYFPSSSADEKTVSRMASQWGGVWGGVEVSNEPDHNRTYDKLSPKERGAYQSQYADYARMVSKGIRQGPAAVPVVGGAFAYALSGDKLDSSRFADGVAAAGLLRSVDAISFHTYVDPKTLQRDIDSFKAWLDRSGRADMPLWITEAGWPWKQGPGRPPLDQDQLSALQIAGKAVVAYGMGISRYYAFVYPYYEENGKNFGMSGRERTPLRSLAAYEQVAKVLSGARAISAFHSLPGNGFGVLFETPKGVVMVMYETRSSDDTAEFSFPFPVLKVEGIDGRLLKTVNGKLPLTDGLVYAWISEADVVKAKEMLRKAK
jgi:hypothetical protein